MLVFVNRAAIVGFAIFLAAVVGFCLQWVAPASVVGESKGMIGSVVGLLTALLSIMLGLLIWTNYGQFMTHHSDIRMVGRAVVHLERALEDYGSQAASGRALLRDYVLRMQERFWGGRDNGVIGFTDMPGDNEPMRAFFATLSPSGEEQRRRREAAINLFETLVETQVTMARSLRNQVPAVLLNVVTAWACILFLAFALQASINALTVVTAALGAGSVASAVFLILELSNPYVGLLNMPHADFDRMVGLLAERADKAVGAAR